MALVFHVSALEAAGPAQIEAFAAPDGETYFALGLKAPDTPATTTPHDHIVLVDTSASQVGEHRLQALRVVKALLDSLPVNDRIALVAIDSKIQFLTSDLVAPNSAAANDAYKALRKRVPLGATDLAQALRAAIDKLPNERPQSLIYIGDGMSTAQAIDAPVMQKLLGELRDQHTPVHAYALGPQTDLQLLGVLAEHTGGLLLVDESKPGKDRKLPEPTDIAHRLADAAHVPVFYTSSVEVSPAIQRLLPAVAPLRSDRETILLGQGELTTPVKVTVKGERDGQLETLEFTITRVAEHPANAFLPRMWTVAAAENGLRVPLAGRQLLNIARDEHELQLSQLVAMAQQALAQNKVKEAERIAWGIKQVDPQNVEARVVLQSVRERNGLAPVREARNDARVTTTRPVQRQVAFAQDEEPTPAEEPAEGEDADKPKAEKPAADDAAPGEEPAAEDMPAEDMPADDAAPPKADKSLLDDYVDQADAPVPASDLLQERQRLEAVMAERLTHEVSQAIEAARQQTRNDPDFALELLKRQLATVAGATDIDPGIREQLRARLETVRLELINEREVFEAEQIRQRHRLALLESRRRLVDQLQLEEDKLRNLIDRARALMAEGDSGDPDAYEESEAVARVAVELRPRAIEGTSALFDAEAAGQLDKIRRQRSLRNDKFLEALYQVELAHVPFPDEPPVLWPPPEVWKALTERRKKWKSVDLKRYNKAEEKIRSALDQPTEIDFVDTPLRDALNYLKDYHEIQIWPNEQALTDEGVAIDTPVSLSLSGVTLRSALKLLLEPLQLRYVIEDEVMKITTAAEAVNERQIRVYPVGDLVIPIMPVGLMGGMMGGGMMGGMMGRGGMMGGMGGMMGGMGGM
ncbi:MAG TPA: VWA domain-containing protein, partial [Planctomycetaceae bacterium]|nr:VWA domain-containing protein [Planctomycetaceae bacterium]